MVSELKKFDKELLLEIGLLIQQLVKTGNSKALDLAESYGQHYLTLEEKINKHDYTQEDEIFNRANNRIK